MSLFRCTFGSASLSTLSHHTPFPGGVDRRCRTSAHSQLHGLCLHLCATPQGGCKMPSYVESLKLRRRCIGDPKFLLRLFPLGSISLMLNLQGFMRAHHEIEKSGNGFGKVCTEMSKNTDRNVPSREVAVSNSHSWTMIILPCRHTGAPSGDSRFLTASTRILRTPKRD